MVKSPATTPPKSWLWGSLTSIRLTVFLLLILAAVAVLGTLVPQDQPLGQYLSLYGEGLGGVLYGWGLARIYYSPWFLLPMGLLAVNILACVVQGLPRAIRRSFRPFTPEAALTLPERGRGVRQETLPDREIYLVQRGRLRPLGPYLVHLAILLILAGGLIGKFWGIEGTLPLDQGEAARTFQVGHLERPLNFQVRLDKFQVQFYDGGGRRS
jgi:cytochrome c biogenesis protein